MTLPTRTRVYKGLVTDSRIWDDFELRAGDIILSTPPKCGTTWSQAILMMLLNGKAETDRMVWQDSLWLDCGFRDQPAMVAELDARPAQRCIKSHTPLDGIPYRDDVTYLTVYRHPIDVHFSLEKHVANMKRDTLRFLFPEAPAAAFARFLNAPMTDTGTDDLTLSSLLYHYRSFARWTDLPNIHYFHFTAMKSDPKGQIRRFAKILGLSPDEDLVDGIAAASSFGSMKRVTAGEAEKGLVSAFADPAGFFDAATSNKWIGRLSDEELAAYRQKIEVLAQPHEIRWLEQGHR